MKNFFATIIALAILATSTMCFAQSSGAMRLGILPVFKSASVSANLTFDDTEIATGVIYAGMANCPYFEILSRTDVDKLVQEHELTATGLIDESTAPKFGRMLGAEYLMITNVTGLSSTKKSGSILGGSKNNYAVTARMAARIVEVESGRVVLAATSSATSNVKVTGNLIRVGRNNFDQGLADEALEKAASDLVKNLLANLEAKKRASR